MGSSSRFVSRAWVWMAAAAAALGTGGCATTQAPVEQVKYFSQAFVAVNTVGQPLLDDMAIAERAVGKRGAERRAQQQAGAGDAASCTSAEATWAIAAGDPKATLNK